MKPEAESSTLQLSRDHSLECFSTALCFGPFQSTSGRHCHSWMVESTARSLTLCRKSTRFGVVERTVQLFTLWEEMAHGAGWSRICSCRVAVEFAADVCEWTVHFGALGIKLTVWMNEQTLVAKFTVGKHFALCVGVMVQTVVSNLARRPKLAALWKFLSFSLNRLYVHVLHHI